MRTGFPRRLTFRYRRYMNTTGMGTTASSTSRPRSRADAKRETRAAVLRAAEAVFRREGFHGASLDQIAREAGFTKGAVYSGFSSKADLFLGLLALRSADRITALQAVEAQAADPEDLARRFAAEFAASVRSEPDWWAVVLEFMSVVARDAGLRARYADHHDRVRETAAAGLAAWFERSGSTPAIAPRALATALLGTMNGITLERLLSPGEVDDELYVTVQVALVRDAIRGATP